jgi:two-component system chemotaxis response regulator CheB
MLPRDFPVPVMIVQHMPKVFTGALADRLNRMCRLSVEQARDAAPIKPGTILLAPGDTHMEVSAARAVRLHQGPPLNSCMPSADYLLRSAAEVYGAGTLALVMTGMGADGLEGARCVKQSGGTVLAQDERTSAVWGMPGRVVKEGLAAQTVALPAIADVLIDRVHRRIHKRFAPDHRREGTHAMH